MTVRGAQSGRRRRNSVRAGVFGEKPRQLDQQAAVKGAHGLLRMQPTGEPTNLKGDHRLHPLPRSPRPLAALLGQVTTALFRNKPIFRMAYIARWTYRNLFF
ncbi:hypothetical protein CEXT_413921 [Caerostris extrusa]|uniref:Uncharacterized protein n=1 Tax=Caerostris extrusa TaxID=172846 RepID=A0AAV4TT71_CAEEX|nr:hypothetical protein CEXT_413921 [Caerostris extrusa]